MYDDLIDFELKAIIDHAEGVLASAMWFPFLVNENMFDSIAIC